MAQVQLKVMPYTLINAELVLVYCSFILNENHELEDAAKTVLKVSMGVH